MEKPNDLLERLSKVQEELKAPKSQRNTFGNYNYRSCEDILEAVKPLLVEHGLTLMLSDKLEHVGDRYYVVAEARLAGSGSSLEVQGWAREEENKKGMDGSQITGAASSYARKYALNGLFLIDDTKDSDATNDHGKAVQAPPKAKPVSPLGAEKRQELVEAFQTAQITGQAAATFATGVIGKSGPSNDAEADKLISAVKALTDPHDPWVQQ